MMRFSDITDTYTVLKIPLEQHVKTDQVLGEGFTFAGHELRDKFSKEEKHLLKANFKMWKAPFRGKLAGWKDDSPTYLLNHNHLVGCIYLCDQNEFKEQGWGQAHYNCIATAYRGKGIYRFMFQEIVTKAALWGLNGLILNTDRFLHPEIYKRWGAVAWRTIDK